MKKQIISMAVMAVVFAACGGSKAPATVVKNGNNKVTSFI